VCLQYFHNYLLTAFLKVQQLMMDGECFFSHKGWCSRGRAHRWWRNKDSLNTGTVCMIEAEVGLSDFVGFSKWIAVLKDLRSVIAEAELHRWSALHLWDGGPSEKAASSLPSSSASVSQSSMSCALSLYIEIVCIFQVMHAFPFILRKFYEKMLLLYLSNFLNL